MMLMQMMESEQRRQRNDDVHDRRHPMPRKDVSIEKLQ